MKKLKVIATAILIVFSAKTHSQPFFTTYGGPEYDKGYFILEDDSGNFIVTGDSGRTTASIYDSQMLLLKADRNGNILWVRTYGDTAGQVARCVKKTNDGGFILNGDQDLFWVGGCESLLMKTDSAGDSLWSVQDYGGMEFRWGISVLPLDDGSFIAGTRNDDIQSENPYQLMKYDSAGNHLWADFTSVSYNSGFGLTGWNGASLIKSGDSTFVTAGIDWVTTAGDPELVICKTDTSGSNLWMNRYLCGTDLSGVSVTECFDGGYMVAGYSNCSNSGYDMMILKTDSNGDSLWSRTYGGNGDDFLTSLAQLPDSGFIVFGHSNSYGNAYDIIIMRLNSNGDSIWQKQYGGTDDEKVQHGIVCHDGSFALTGSTRSYGAGNEDLFILRTDSSGALISNLTQPAVPLLSLYPNPAATSVKITGQGQMDRISVMDLSGRIISIQRVSEAEAVVAIENLSPGIYLCEIEFTNGQRMTGKIVKAPVE